MLGRVTGDATSLRFADAARILAEACRRRGLEPPAFRSPPARPGVDRTLRRQPEGGAVVAVRVRGRPYADVAADLVEGVLAANRIAASPDAHAVRAELLAAVGVPPPARAA
jgi:hypothetical protein